MAHMKTNQAATKHKRSAAAFKHSAAEHWMLSGKSVWIIAGELGKTQYPCSPIHFLTTKSGKAGFCSQGGTDFSFGAVTNHAAASFEKL